VCRMCCTVAVPSFAGSRSRPATRICAGVSSTSGAVDRLFRRKRCRVRALLGYLSRSSCRPSLPRSSPTCLETPCGRGRVEWHGLACRTCRPARQLDARPLCCGNRLGQCGSDDGWDRFEKTHPSTSLRTGFKQTRLGWGTRSGSFRPINCRRNCEAGELISYPACKSTLLSQTMCTKTAATTSCHATVVRIHSSFTARRNT